MLPLRSCSWLPFGALVVGSLSPDAGYYLGAVGMAARAHTLAGVITVCVPLSIALMVVMRFLHRPVGGLLPSPHRQVVLSLSEFRWPTSVLTAACVCLAIIIGAMTHIVWDAFTHPAGYFVSKLPGLRAVTFSMDGRDVRLFEVMQHVSTIVGVLVLAVVYRRVCGAVTRGSLGPLGSDVWRYVLLGTAAVASMAVAGPIAYFGASPGRVMNVTLLVVRFVIVSTTVFAVLLAVAALVVVQGGYAVSSDERDA